jgi:hypothetical protein
MKKMTLMLSGVLAVGFGVLLAFAGPSGGPQNYVSPVVIVPPTVDYVKPAVYAVPATNVTMIAPPRNLLAAPAWTNTATYKNGDIVVVGTRFYWNAALVYTGCVSTTGPVAISDDTTDGGITWRRCYQTPRQGIDIANIGAITAWLSFEKAAVVGSGLPLAASATWSMTGNQLQAAVYAIVTNTLSICVQER